jgi:uncharacterized protein
MKHRIASRLIEFSVGLLFGCGLLISGMTNPAKVLGFLDLAGLWDPSLALVMASAIGVGFFAFGLARRRTQTLLGNPLQLPTSQRIDRRLLMGALLFGTGWGWAGFCPGPALVAMAAGHGQALLFVAAMLAGMALFEVVERLSRRSGVAAERSLS